MPKKGRIHNQVAVRTAFVGHRVDCYNKADGCNGFSTVYCLAGDPPPPKICAACHTSGAPGERGLGGLGKDNRSEEIRYVTRPSSVNMGTTIYTPEHPDFPAIASQCTPILEIKHSLEPLGVYVDNAPRR